MMLFDVCLTSVCLSRTSGLSREHKRPRKTKIGTDPTIAYAWVTRTPLSRSKGQRSRSPGRFAYRRVCASGGCSGGRGNVLAVENCCYVAVCRHGGRLGGAGRFGAHRGRRGAGTYRDGRPPTACWLNEVIGSYYRFNAEFQRLMLPVLS